MASDGNLPRDGSDLQKISGWEKQDLVGRVAGHGFGKVG